MQNEKLVKEIKRLLAKDKLPNGERVSRRNIGEYLFEKGYTYVNNSGKKVKYTSHGIQNIVNRINSQGVELNGIDDLNKKINIIGDGFDFEEGIEDSLPDYIIHPGSYKALIINDVHIPYHSLSSLKTALHNGKEERVNKVILNGDILDIYSLSRWDKRPDRQLVRDELEMGRKFMHQIRKMFPSEEIIFKVGNHEDRFSQYIMKKAPELFGLDCVTLTELLDLKQLGIKMIGSSQLIQAGYLTIMHGHEILNSGAVINVARTKRLKAQDNILFGHHHRTQSDFATSIKGKLHGSYAVGCLCNLRPAYFTMAYQEWNHGFAIVEVNEDGMFKVHNRKIINGEVY